VLAEPDVASADRVLVGGDVVSGPMPRECLDLLLALGERVLFVRGNADRAVVERVEEHGGAWCAERLGEERLGVMRDWPLTVSCDIDGVGAVLLCHATPRSDEEIVTRATPDADLAEAVAAVAADLVVCGHTHIQFDRRPGRSRVVNAGSVGMPYEGRRGAFWALLGPDVEHRRTDYDVEGAVAAIRATASPTAGELAEWLAEPPDPDETTAYFEGLRPNVS
jgi:predicted phosphodiesterase